MTRPKIAFVGMTHLGLISAVAASEKGFQVFCFDPDINLIESLKKSEPPVSEPQLIELMAKNYKLLQFSCDPKTLKNCPVIYVAPDVSTDDQGQSDLGAINKLLNIVFENTTKKNVIVILSQVPPGFTRTWLQDDRTLYYQVETLIFGQAINRALLPERYIIGCLNPKAELPIAYREFLESHCCPVLPMRFESAELAKISINMCLVASVATANTLAELCEKIGADWSEIVPALRLDKRIGQFSYLKPGLGISGGNLERDLATVINYADKYNTDCGVVKAWIKNSQIRKNWVWDRLRALKLDVDFDKRIGILGLTYKESTHSVKNSPALQLLKNLARHRNVFGYDPMAIVEDENLCYKRLASLLGVLKNTDVLIIMTPWEEFKNINLIQLSELMKGGVIIDPHNILDGNQLRVLGFE